jgi:copper homeostasis protein CutC
MAELPRLSNNDGMPDDEPRAPWDHQSTPLARAFARAFDRFQAVAGQDAEQLIATGQDKVFALSGLELDTIELGLYMEALVAGYTQMALEGDDAHAIAVMRGLAVHALVVGELHAADRISAERLHDAVERARRELLAGPFAARRADARRAARRGPDSLVARWPTAGHD